MSNARYHDKEIKKGLYKSDLADFFTISKYGFSPYRACEHGCLYCDGRAEKYYVEGEFEKDIIIRRNLPDLLKDEIPKLREKAFIGIGSGVSDAYQPIERETKIMHRCAEILLKYDFPVAILTKSSLALRDLDLWAEINKKSKFLLMVSITSAEDTYRKVFEPGASTIDQRFDMIRQFKAAGCSVGVLAMPLLPCITETEKNMLDLAAAVKQAGADFCMPGGVTLRPGIQKETFLNCLKEHYPQYIDTYNQIYAENRQSGAPSKAWIKTVQPTYSKFFETGGLSPVVPHSVFRNHVSLYEEVFLVLCLMKVAYEYRSVDTKRLQKATDLYRTWISSVRRPISRSRKLLYSNVDTQLSFVCTTGQINSIVANEKCGETIKRIVLGREIFDFCSMRFV